MILDWPSVLKVRDHDLRLQSAQVVGTASLTGYAQRGEVPSRRWRYTFSTKLGDKAHHTAWRAIMARLDGSRHVLRMPIPDPFKPAAPFDYTSGVEMTGDGVDAGFSDGVGFDAPYYTWTVAVAPTAGQSQVVTDWDSSGVLIEGNYVTIGEDLHVVLVVGTTLTVQPPLRRAHPAGTVITSIPTGLFRLADPEHPQLMLWHARVGEATLELVEAWEDADT